MADRMVNGDPGGGAGHSECWELRLYVAGQTPKSLAALANLRKLCEDHLRGRYSIEVVDLVQRPQLARGDQILAIPTLVRKLPTPMKKIVGDLSNTERALVGMDLRRSENGKASGPTSDGFNHLPGTA